MAELEIIKIKEISFTLAKSVESLSYRSFFSLVKLGEPRIKVLRGFRGVGKTTVLLQLMSKLQNAIYLSMDHPYIEGFNIYQLGKELIKNGYKTLLIDEIHYYKNWEKDTKALYDEFPEVNLILSGSVPLAFEPERRYEIIDADPMSFAEFAKLKGQSFGYVYEGWKTIDECLKIIASNSWIYEYFNNYLNDGGAFPISFSYKEKTLSSLYSSIRKSIREDAPFFSNVDGEDVRAMEKLLMLLATSTLGEFSINSIAKTLEITKYKGYSLVSLLEDMKILRMVRPYGRGPKLVRGDPKLMFYHPNLRSAVCHVLGITPNIGALREELAVFSFIGRGWNVYTIKGRKKNPDYLIEKGKERFVIEVGGENKGKSQLEGFKESLVITEKQLIILSLF
ncbi:MAG: AAA family ATPase [Candidatus Micrarchaeota archaeon]|nr:AAA family ATPase [Candidatus Micrarchaeota archaeon]